VLKPKREALPFLLIESRPYLLLTCLSAS